MGEHDTLAQLAARVSEMQTSIAAFGARLDQETGPVMVLQSKVKNLSGQLDALQKQLEEIAGTLAKTGAKEKDAKPGVSRWDVGDKDALNKRYEELRAWVEGWLRREYPGYVAFLPVCWPAHREAMWELAALHGRWKTIFGKNSTAEEVPLDDVGWWHERWLPGALHRLAYLVKCTEARRCQLEKPKQPAKPAAPAGWETALLGRHSAPPKDDGQPPRL